MIPQQTFESYPVFGDNATKIKPDDAKYAAGFQQSDVLPAEWMNWAWGKNTKGITDLNRGMTSVETEILNVLTAGGQTPAEATGNQLLQSINYLIGQAETRAKLAAHPVGSLYWSGDSTDPGQLFGGTWTPVKDCFVWAKGDNDTPNAIGQNAIAGGAKTVTLTESNLPSHRHSYTPTGNITGGSYKFTGSAVNAGSGGNWMFRIRRFSDAADNDAVISTSYKTNLTITTAGGSDCTGNRIQRITNTSPEYTKVEHSGHQHSVTAAGTISVTTNPTFTGSASNTGYTGSGTAVDKMPPYIIKYCWERTA